MNAYEALEQGGNIPTSIVMMILNLFLLVFMCGYPAMLNSLVRLTLFSVVSNDVQIQEPAAIIRSTPELWFSDDAYTRELVSTFYERVDSGSNFYFYR